ncbi:Tho complex subunit 7-domain-containing protein [Elsinoe ampelina]|uniref:Tho complex subunit 7-domain-containing protein n=1 Tax=Elsinoe ampelina TaxID=302913 RepID=A0A6A6GQI9_9PEZI|nr:Tho complex subunit 7-domain-containing protein [Elsinoe ampelina]
MSAADFGLLDPAEEDALHLRRLLTVDERPFQRISKRLLAKDALIRKFPVQLPTPPPDATAESEAAAESEANPSSGQELSDAERQKYHDDILLDFQGLEATLIRIQLLKNANDREQERYAAEKSKILATAEAVRANTAELRVQLEEAQHELKLKKEYDSLADAILKDKALKPRDILEAENDKLRNEIEDLEQEAKDFAGLWQERRDRFTRVVEEGKSLVRFIKGEKDEPEEGEDEGSQEGGISERKGDSSNVGTPRPDAGNSTPLHAGLDGEEGAHAAQQAITQRALGSSLQVPGMERSRSSSPAPQSFTEGSKDTEMKGAEDPALDNATSGTGNEGAEKMDTT